MVDLRELLPSVGLYRLSLLFMLVQLAILRTRRAAPSPAGSEVCAPSGMTCFLPVLVWGIESAFHSQLAMFGESRFCFGIPPWAFVEQGVVSAVIGLALLCGGFLSEHWARRAAWPVRQAQASLPLGVVAGLVSVQLVWVVHLMAYLPAR